jgi:Lar family restriction alleviation protein
VKGERTNVRACPFCGSHAVFAKPVLPAFAAVCENCGTIGPLAKFKETAILKWNKRPRPQKTRKVKR